MSKLLVVGNINIETTVKIPGFPINYQSATFVPFGVNNGVSGVGYNLAKALTTLGDEVAIGTIVGRDLTATMIRAQLGNDGISDRFVLGLAERSPLSVVAYDAEGRRTQFVDLKDMFEQRYPLEQIEPALQTCDALLLTQIGYCRDVIEPARRLGKLIAVDLQLISSLEDEYKKTFLAVAQVVFMSSDELPEAPESWAAKLLERYPKPEVVIIGLGAQGALLATRADNKIQRVPAVKTRPIVNTSGAGDALYASFMHYYSAGADPSAALQKAVVFASYKIGDAVSSSGYLDQAALENLCDETRGPGNQRAGQ